MKKIFITIVFLFILLTFHSPVHAQKVLLDEDFTTNRNGWYTYTAKPVFIIYNGKQIFSVSDSTTYNINMPITLEDNTNFTITVTATHTDGTDIFGYGIFFGASDLSNYYTFDITSGGYYRVERSSSTGTTDLIKWTMNTAVKTGNYVDNIIQLSRQGTNWIIVVNGQTLATIPSTGFFGNKLGFTVSEPQRVEFDNLKVVLN